MQLDYAMDNLETILREEIDGKVILRVGRRLPGIRPVGGVYAPATVG